MKKSGLRTAALLISAGFLAACATPVPTVTPLPTRAYAPEPEADFALSFDYGSCLPESVDTFQGTFTRAMCPPDPAVTVALTLTPEELRTIYREMVSIDFFGYPDPFSVVVPEGAVVGKVTPASSYYLRVRNGAVEKELHWTDDITDPTTKEADQLRAFLQRIIDIIYRHPEIKLVPEPSCGCA